MKSAVIVYGSTTGNTQQAAEWIQEALSLAGTKADISNVAEMEPASAAPYDLIVLGASTWGQGDIQDDFVSFYDGMTADVFGGKKVAVFGCGDSGMFPDYFCQAVDLIAEKVKACGGEIVSEPLRIDGDVRAHQSDIADWAKGLV